MWGRAVLPLVRPREDGGPSSSQGGVGVVGLETEEALEAGGWGL